MNKYCCSDFKKATSYQKPKLTPAGKLWLLEVGRNKVPYKNVLRLAKLVSNKKQLVAMPKHKPNEIITVPVLLPISFCPFCGEKIRGYG